MEQSARAMDESIRNGSTIYNPNSWPTIIVDELVDDLVTQSRAA